MVKRAKRVALKKSGSATLDPVQRELASMNAKQQFVSASLSMGWQLAITVIVPIAIGIKLDDYFDTSPSLVLAALVIATAGSISIVSTTIKNVNRELRETDKKGNIRAKKSD